jgi:hypothetical protein
MATTTDVSVPEKQSFVVRKIRTSGHRGEGHYDFLFLGLHMRTLYFFSSLIHSLLVDDVHPLLTFHQWGCGVTVAVCAPESGTALV